MAMFIFCIIIQLSILYYYIIYQFFDCGRIGKHVKKIPGPFVWPILGNLPALNAPLEALWKLAEKWDKKYYPIYKIWTSHRVVVVILDPDDIETVITSMKHIDKSIIYCTLHQWLGTGLLTSTGKKWQKRRKILTPAFHFNVLQKYMNNIVENSEKVVESIKSKGTAANLDVVPMVTDYTLNVICETAMGSTLEDKQDNNYREKYRSAIHDMGKIVIFRLMNPWFQVNWTFRWTSLGRLQTKALNVLHSFTRKIIDERKEYHKKTNGQFLKQFSDESSNDTAEDEYLGYRKKRLAMLDLLIAAQKDGGQIDDDGIREEVDTFMFEGHDTTAMALSFLLLLIAEHKDAQERIRSEVNEVLEKSDGKITMSEIQQLNYTELCVKESLRLYPSVPIISRGLNEDVQLKNYLIPKGSLVNFHVFSLHRNPRFWNEPEKFDPERFLPERFAEHHPFSYIPFSAGPRNCIGQKFAMLELKAFLAHIVHNFYLEPIDLAHEIPLQANLVIRPCSPMRVKFIPIDK